MKNKKLCLLLMSTLALVACNNTPKPSGSSSLDPNSGTSDVTTTTDNTSVDNTSTGDATTSTESSSSVSSSSTPEPQKSWSVADISVMESLLGEAIPYVQLADNYVCIKDSDADGDYIYIYDESSTNLLTNYSATLEAAGYTYVGEETDSTSNYTAYFYSKDDIVIQYDYYPGDSEYSASNEIYAWIDSGTIVGGVQTTDTSWPEKLSNAMTTMYGFELPFIALDEAYYYQFDVDSKELLIGDDTETNYLIQEDYEATLLEAGFVLDNVDNSAGYDVTTYTKAIDENYQLIVSVDFFPGSDTYSPGNEIYAYVDEIIHPVTSSTWPSEQIDTLLGATYNIPSFIATGDYTYFTYAGGLAISGQVDSDISEAYLAQANENGLLTGENYDFITDESSYYIYNWEENFTINYSYSLEDSSFLIYISPTQPTYNSLEDIFPSDQIVAFLGEGKTEVPAFDCEEGKNYKVTKVEANPEYGITPFLMINAIDNGSFGTDSIVDKYVAILENAGWTVDTSDYDSSGYIATTSNNDVCLTFYTQNEIFYLFVEEASSSTVAEGVFDLSTSDAQVTTNSATQVVYTSGQYTVTIDKGTAASAANNYLGNGVHVETRVYKGQTLTIGATEGTLGTIVIETSSTVDAEAFNECMLTNCTATIEGTTVTLTPTEGATSVTINTSSLSGKRLNLISISIL